MPRQQMPLRFLVLFWFVAAALSAGEFHIMMVQWRGETEAEIGFREYLDRSGLAIRWTVYDCKLDPARGTAVPAEIAAAKPDLVYAFSTNGALAVVGRHDAPTAIDPAIPVVFTVVGDPVGAGLVPALTGHGRNLTGVSHLVPMKTQLTVLSQVATFKKLGMIDVAKSVSAHLIRQELETLAKDHGYVLSAATVTPGGVPAEAMAAAATELLAQKPDAVYLPSDGFLIANAAAAIAPLTAAGIPVFSATEQPVRKSGALLGVVASYRAVGRFAGAKAERILRGAKAGDVPIEPLPSWQVVYNAKVARQVNIYPPVGLLKLAEAVE